MKYIAHRGLKDKNIKENTIEAFDNALNNGYLGFECDVRKTKDNYLVICHDAFINRVTDDSGLILAMTYDEIKTISGNKIPLLKEVLTKYSCIKLIELKTHIDFNDIKDYIDENTYIMSFDSNYMFKLKSMYKDYKFGVLNYVLNSKDNYNLDFICLLDIIATDNLVNYFKSRNIKVFIYGIGKQIKYKSESVYYIID